MTDVKPKKFQKSLQSVYILWAAIFFISFLVQFSGWVEVWRYDRLRLQQGDYWLLFSAHLSHSNWSHWGLNMVGLGIVAVFFSAYARVWQWLLVCILSALMVSAGVDWFNHDIRYYVGLSGVLHGLFIFGALREIKTYALSGYVLVALLMLKLGWEFFYGALPGSEDLTDGRVLTDAHLYGAIGGVLSAGLLWIKSRI